MSDVPKDKKIIGYEEFRYICFFDENGTKRTNHFGGFRLEREGLFLVRPEDTSTLFAGELAVLAGDYDQAALAFPCTTKELRGFVAEVGLTGCIDEDNLVEVIAAKVKSAAPFNQGATLKKNALIAKYKRTWPTIELDFQEAPDNGLLEEAAAIEYGHWVVEKCLKWATGRNKLIREPTQATPFTGLGARAKR